MYNVDPYLIATAIALAEQDDELTEEQETILASRNMLRY